MAGVFFSYNYKGSLPATDPTTLFQILAASNHGCYLHGIDISPLGSTAGSVPLEFELLEQTSAGVGGSDSSASLQKKMPVEAYPETIQTTILTDMSTEPTDTGSVLGVMSVHQQSTLRWVPADGPIRVDGATRLGFIYRDTQTTPVSIMFYMEE